jgi:hypothetical protein
VAKLKRHRILTGLKKTPKYMVAFTSGRGDSRIEQVLSGTFTKKAAGKEADKWANATVLPVVKAAKFKVPVD